MKVVLEQTPTELFPWLLGGRIAGVENNTANSEKIALVYFLRLASDAKLKFAMISAATISV